jgi:excinuclease ABC subunit A
MVRTLADGGLTRYSSALHCAACDLAYKDPSPALFSYNHPLGACPACRGFGRIIDIDYRLVMPDHSRTLKEGVVKPWLTGVSAECQSDLLKIGRTRGVPFDVPFESLDSKWQRWVIDGDPGYVIDDPEKSWPKLWYGVKGYFRWLESKSYKMHVRVLLSRYRSYTTCPTCHGQRFNPDSLLYCLKVPSKGAESEGSLTLSDFYKLPVSEAFRLVESTRSRLALGRMDPVETVLGEVSTRLGYLVEVGLGYLTLDRPTRTLSGGETERVNLTTCLGTRLVNTLFVMDEPSVGLHPRDTERLIRILQRLRDVGNTVVVIEHELSLIRAADYLVDIGPGHGESGGQVVFQGPPEALRSATGSLTADYLTGRRSIPLPKRRKISRRADGTFSTAFLALRNATANNLHEVDVDIPLGRLVCVTGVSGSGKSTLVREVLVPAIKARLATDAAEGKRDKASTEETEDSAETDSDDVGEGSASRPASVTGWETLGGVVMVDQSSLGKTPRSNPAVYVGAFGCIRDLFAATSEAKELGLNASAFSFNSSSGQCGRCRGAGFEKIEMQFLSDVFVRCPECHGRRYRPHILDVRVTPPNPRDKKKAPAWSIADFLEAPIEESVEWLHGFEKSRSAKKAADALQLLCDVGLGYLRAGQPINTLSGGESQRLKLASFLATAGGLEGDTVLGEDGERVRRKPVMFVFDEPTTGLHIEDVRVLLQVFQRLVDAGHSVVVIEHNLDVIQASDWVVDLGPEAGEMGGRIVVEGTPEEVAQCEASHTGRFLRALGHEASR